MEGAATAEQASAWLTLEVLAGRTGDPATREEALAQRAKFARQATWRALLLVDRARLAAAAGRGRRRRRAAARRRAVSARRRPGWRRRSSSRSRASTRARAPSRRGRARRVHANALDAIADLVRGVARRRSPGRRPRACRTWMRQPARLVDAGCAPPRRVACWGRSTGRRPSSTARSSTSRGLDGRDMPPAEAALANARIRIAEQTGDTALAAASRSSASSTEKDGGLAAALALRVAEHAAAQGDGPRALEALSRAIASDPGSCPRARCSSTCSPTAATPARFAAQLESFATTWRPTRRAGARSCSRRTSGRCARTTAGAKAALRQAAMYGVPPATIGRVARTLASLAGDAAWYEDATKRLARRGRRRARGGVAARGARARRDTRASTHEGAAQAIREMAGAPRGAWLARVPEAFLPRPRRPRPTRSGRSSRRARASGPRGARALETRPDLARGLAARCGAPRARGGDPTTARRQLAGPRAGRRVRLLRRTLPRRSRARCGRPRRSRDGRRRRGGGYGDDAELAAALHLEAGLENWRAGERGAALEEFESASPRRPRRCEARARVGDARSGRRRDRGSTARARCAEARGAADSRVSRSSGSRSRWAPAIPTKRRRRWRRRHTREGDLRLAAAIARLVWPAGSADEDAMREAIVRVASRGPRAPLPASGGAAAPRARSGRPRRGWRARRAGGSTRAAASRPRSSGSRGDGQRLSRRRRSSARLAVAAALAGDAREAITASAALLAPRIHPNEPAPLVVASPPAARLANLELSPPGCDPRRRASTLVGARHGARRRRGERRESLAGWSALAAGEAAAALASSRAPSRRARRTSTPGKVCARAPSSRRQGATRARASELGARCHDAARGAAFWEESALSWLELGDDARAESALDASFARDATRRGVRQAVPPRARAQGQRQAPRPDRAPPRGHRRPAGDPEALLGAGPRAAREGRPGRRARGARARHDARPQPRRRARAARRDQHPPRQLRAGGRVARAPRGARPAPAEEPRHRRRRRRRPLREQAESLRPGARGPARPAPGEALDAAGARAARARRRAHGIVDRGHGHPRGADARAPRAEGRIEAARLAMAIHRDRLVAAQARRRGHREAARGGSDRRRGASTCSCRPTHPRDGARASARGARDALVDVAPARPTD